MLPVAQLLTGKDSRSQGADAQLQTNDRPTADHKGLASELTHRHPFRQG